MRSRIAKSLPGKLLSSALLALSGCYSFSTAGVPNTVPFPPDYLTRSIIGSPTAEYDLCDMVGFVAEQTAGANGGNPVLAPFLPVVKANAPAPKTTVVPSAAAVKYSDIVTKQVSAKGSYAIFASNMADNEAASVVMQDVAYCKVPLASLPTDQLMRFTIPAGKNYVWVSGAVLTTIDYTVGIQQSGGATLTGTAFGVGGNVYAGNNQKSELTLIGAETVDIGKLQVLCSGSGNPCGNQIPAAAAGGPVPTTPVVAPPTAPPTHTAP